MRRAVAERLNVEVLLTGEKALKIQQVDPASAGLARAEAKDFG
jgi:hypothetical protein